jgi:hypothetical protein
MTRRPPRHIGPRRFLLSLAIFFGAAATVGHPSADTGGLPPAEAGKIEALIAVVARMRDAAFIRNDRIYDSAVAAEFLRRKWQAQASNVACVEDFIEKVASFSSSTGRPYLIRFGDGREISSSDFLHAELAKLQRGKR